MDRLAAMETFVRVVETGSFSAAACQLHSSAGWSGSAARLDVAADRALGCLPDRATRQREGAGLRGVHRGSTGSKP